MRPYRVKRVKEGWETHYIVERKLLFFWYEVRFYSIGCRELGFTEDQCHTDVVKKFPSLSEAYQVIEYNIRMRGLELYRRRSAHKKRSREACYFPFPQTKGKS